MRKFRVSAVLAAILGIVGFVLGLLMLLAGKEPGYLDRMYVLRLNTTRVGEDIIRFDTASTSTAPTPTTSSSSSPLDPLNPFSTASPLNPNNPSNPLNQLTDSLGPIIDDLTDSLNDGLGEAFNRIVDGLVDATGVKGVYSLYLNRVCEQKESNGTDDGALERCLSYPDAVAELHRTVPNFQSFIVIGRTNISIPFIAELSHSGESILGTLISMRLAILAFLIISLIGSGLTTLFAIASVFFPASRLLIYANLFITQLSSLSAFLSALVVTVPVVGASLLVRGMAAALSVITEWGRMILSFLWISWAVMAVAGVYWGVVWFVEVRRWSFTKRARTDEEVGNWRGIKREVWRDLKRRKSS